MAHMTVYGDPDGAVIQDSNITEYYKDWYYFGRSIGGQDTYAYLEGGRMINLSLVFSSEDGDYGSPCYYNITSNPQWYKENSHSNYELAMKVQDFLACNSNIQPWSTES
jgi:hypothetical protein